MISQWNEEPFDQWNPKIPEIKHKPMTEKQPKTMEEGWMRYYNAAYPDKLDPESERYREIRGAFYAGALEFIANTQNIVKNTKDEKVCYSKVRELMKEVSEQIKELCKVTTS